MPHFSCYLPEGLLTRLDEQVRRTPRGNRSGIMREALQHFLDDQPTTVKDVFSDAFAEVQVRGNGPPIKGAMDSRPRTVNLSRADIFHRATQR